MMNVERVFYSVLILFSIFASSIASASMVFRSGETINLSGGFDDTLFAAGGKVDLQIRSTDDAYVAGGEVLFTGVEVEDLITAAGNLRLSKTSIKDDLVAAGGKVELDAETTVGGSALIAGQSIKLAGRIDGDLRIYAETIELEPSAVIVGNLIYAAENFKRADGARIDGTITADPIKKSKASPGFPGIFGGLLFVLGALLVAPTLMVLFPRTITQAQGMIATRFWETIGIGTVCVLSIPVLWLLTLFSVVGTPLALAAIPFLIAACFLAWPAPSLQSQFTSTD